MDLSLIYEMKEKIVDEQKRTVIAGVLEEDVLSANNRFYPAKIVRKAISTLSGKRSLVTHESNDPRDVVAKIIEARMKGKLGVATFKFGTDATSEAVFSKVKEGLIDAVSIRGNGSTKRAKLEGSETFVDVVEELEISSVDWVVEGGISSARVMQVFEQAPQINYTNEQEPRNFDDCMSMGGDMSIKDMGDGMVMPVCKMTGKSFNGKTMNKQDAKKMMNQESLRRKGINMDELQKLQKQVEEQNAKIAEMQKKSDEEKSATEAKIAEANKKAEEEKLNAYKSKKLAMIKNDSLRAYVGENISGGSEKEVDESFKKHVEFFEKFTKENKLKEEIVVKPNDMREIKPAKTVNELLEQVPAQDQVSIIASLMGGKK